MDETARGFKILQIAIAACLIYTVAAGLGARLRAADREVFAFGDLRPTYCAAAVVRSGADPYRAEPLGACERASVGLASDFVQPAPLSGATVLFFAWTAPLSFARTAFVWCLVLVGALVASAALLVPASGLSFVRVVVALVPLGFLAPAFLGQLVPVAVALVVCAAVALERRADASAAVLCALATVEPHLALFSLVAVFLARPRARLPAAVAASALLALSVAAVGTAATIEYLTRVLPAQTRAEAAYDDQYSLTYALAWLRVPIDAAIAAGELQFFAMGAVGVALGRRLAFETGRAGYMVYVPLAFATIGGPYVHVEDVLAAVPLALLALRDASSRLRPFAGVALALVALPGKMLASLIGVAGGSIGVPLSRIGTAPQQLASEAWGRRIAADTGHLAFLFVKIPTWIGLLLLVAVVVAGARRPAAFRLPLRPSPVRLRV